MGSDERSRKRRSPSVSEEEGRKKRRRKEDREDKRKRKKEKEKGKKSHKHSKHDSDRGTKSIDKHDHKHSKRTHHSDFEEISSNDYFSKNNEFSTWLKEEKGIFFSDLSSDDARKLFSRFVKDWNRQKLPSRYYEGIKTGPRSAHSWKIRD
ncbi:style cell-cycle inhibitor 1-A [Aristolochia californica]|uniref:style cell-cycle inhibitor 1-A n=1 Tax=Aristolochia californica TaxID=171875 RepID=UPI0035D69930